MKLAIVTAAALGALLGAWPGRAAAQTDLLRIRGAASHDGYGFAIGPAGDVDGDGVGDLLVGSPDDDTNGTDAGRVRVLSGSDFSLLREHFGDAAADRLGYGIGKAVGDIDGDGFDDYVLGAMQSADLISYGLGYVRAYSGPTGALLHEWIGTELDAAFGDRPTVIGDIDGDGFADVAVPAIYHGSGATDYRGAVYIYSGKDGALIWKNAGTSANENYGYALARVGDVDGDGVVEFAIGAVGRQVNGYWRGGVEVWSGKSGALLFSEIGGLDDWFGGALADVGDLDGDGVPDLLVGSFNDSFPAKPGEAHVYSLKTGAELYCFSGTVDGDLFGYAVAGLDDLDGDGVPEFAITAPTGAAAPPWTGRCSVYSGRRGLLLADLESGSVDDAFGAELMVHHDLDGDGRREFLVGAPSAIYSLPTVPGAIHLFSWADCHASAQAYGAGWPGTLGVPSLAASNPPWLGEPIDIVLGNSYGQPTIALVLMGFGKAQIAS
ncbi:MAG: FG-GAP repeat protein, partial [Planctomycetes bacterium]|nr:FG-GAP repeat protein [Planctomycetota bacterium]